MYVVSFNFLFAFFTIATSNPFNSIQVNTDVENEINYVEEIKIKWPVILIPGLSGSKVEAKLDKTEVVSRFCAKKSDWFLIWLSLTEMTPMVIQCFFDNFRLVFNETTGISENAPGVETRIPDFGGTSAIEFLSYYRFSKSKSIHKVTIN